MSAQSDMTSALNAVEAAAQQLATALVNYNAAYKIAAQATYAAETNPGRAFQNVQDLDHAVGPGRLARLANGRLIALGAETVIAQPHAVAGPADVTWLLDAIQRHVPVDAAAAVAAG